MKFLNPPHVISLEFSSDKERKYFPKKHVKKLVSKNLSFNLKQSDKASHSHLFINQTKKRDINVENNG